jgi:hypothetical protein
VRGADLLGCTGTKHSTPRARTKSNSDRVERLLMVKAAGISFRLRASSRRYSVLDLLL